MLQQELPVKKLKTCWHVEPAKQNKVATSIWSKQNKTPYKSHTNAVSYFNWVRVYLCHFIEHVGSKCTQLRTTWFIENFNIKQQNRGTNLKRMRDSSLPQRFALPEYVIRDRSFLVNFLLASFLAPFWIGLYCSLSWWKSSFSLWYVRPINWPCTWQKGAVFLLNYSSIFKLFTENEPNDTHGPRCFWIGLSMFLFFHYKLKPVIHKIIPQVCNII